MANILELTGIRKSFGRLKALDEVDFAVRKGTIHALLGENGAGKTTLVNIVFGFLRPDGGSIVFDGKTFFSITPQIAMAAGIGMVHQHFKLVDEFTVAENIALGSKDWKEALTESGSSNLRNLVYETGLDVGLHSRIEQLSLGARQRVEILKALFRGARLLILDEPTAVLTPQETDELFAVLAKLRDGGTSIIIITHKLAEALAIASDVTVLRSGQVALNCPVSLTSERQIAEAMVGRALRSLDDRRQASRGDVLLKVQSICYRQKQEQGIKDISFDLRSGEILGIAGVEGNGQAALADMLAGVNQPSSGNILLNGKDITSLGVAQRLISGLAHIPGDRQGQALVMDFSVQENLLLGRWPESQFRKGPFILSGKTQSAATQIIHDYDIRGASYFTPALSLSGGNQQRLVIGRQFGANPQVLIAVNPTRGLDVGAIEYVHARIREHQLSGGAVVLISTELDEIIKLSNSIRVLYRGRLSAMFPAGTPRETIGLIMANGETPS